MVRITKCMESVGIIGMGLIFHLNRWSIIELKESTLPALVPNIASTLFTFSLLCILNTMRPFWPRGWYRPRRFLSFIIEMAVILFAVDFLLRQIWIPSLRLLNFMCNFMGQHIVLTMAQRAPILTQWVRKEAFYVGRFLLAFTAFILMLDTTGMIELAVNKVKHRYAVSVAGGSAPSSRLRDEIKLHKHAFVNSLTHNMGTNTDENDYKPAAGAVKSNKAIRIIWNDNNVLPEEVEMDDEIEINDSYENDVCNIQEIVPKETDEQKPLAGVYRTKTIPHSSSSNGVGRDDSDSVMRARPKRLCSRRTYRTRHANNATPTAHIATAAGGRHAAENVVENDTECQC